MKNNLKLVASKNDKGFISLYLKNEEGLNVPIQVCDYGGTQKKKAYKLTYKLYMLANGEENGK